MAKTSRFDFREPPSARQEEPLARIIPQGLPRPPIIAEYRRMESISRKPGRPATAVFTARRSQVYSLARPSRRLVDIGRIAEVKRGRA